MFGRVFPPFLVAPLARIETGQHNIQGTDYFYTLQGWIKGVNSIGLTNAREDLGRDGYTAYAQEAANPTFNKDEYAYALNYYDGDYVAREGNIQLGKAFYANEQYEFFEGYQDKLGGVGYRRQSLYNGNIAAMATSIAHFGEEQSTQSMNYRYDQLHRIAAGQATKWQGVWTNDEDSYLSSYSYDKNGNIQSLYRNDRDAVTIDDLEYYYDGVKKNRLDAVKDIGGTAEGLGNTEGYEYTYDKIGNLVKNATDGIENIEWNIYGKVTKVTKTPDPFGIQATIDYRYDGTGNRIMKKVTTGATRTTTTYLRDASGNVMAIYEDKTDQTLVIKEIPIYGSSRLGQYRPKTDAKKTALGQRIYEFSNHLGNVLVTLTDNKVPQTDGTYESVVLSASDYYPFGMAMSERTYSNSEYRYGFNGQEQSDELDQNGNSYTAEFWQYSASIGRRWNLDPVFFPSHSPYSTFLNNPIRYNDPSGDCPTCPNNGKIGDTHIWAGETFTFDGTDWSMQLEEVTVTEGIESSFEPNLALLAVPGYAAEAASMASAPSAVAAGSTATGTIGTAGVVGGLLIGGLITLQGDTPQHRIEANLKLNKFKQLHKRRFIMDVGGAEWLEYQNLRRDLEMNYPMDLSNYLFEDRSFSISELTVSEIINGDENDIAHIVKKIRDGKDEVWTTQPIQVTFLNGRVILVNGHHRLAAARYLGLEKLIHVKFVHPDDLPKESYTNISKIRTSVDKSEGKSNSINWDLVEIFIKDIED